MRIQNIPLSNRLLQLSRLSVNGQGDKKEANKVQVLFGEAATWQRSEMSKKVLGFAEWENGKGPKQKELDALQALDRGRSEKKDAANELEQLLDDSVLSEEDKSKIREEINKLREEAKSPQDEIEDAIKELEKKLIAAKKQQEDVLPEEQQFLETQISHYQEEIKNLENKKARENSKIDKLTEEASEEEARRLAEKIHEDVFSGKKEENSGPSFEASMEVQQLLLKKKKEENSGGFISEVMGEPKKEEPERVKKGMKESTEAEKEPAIKGPNKNGADR